MADEDPPALPWRKSSFSGNEGECVEVAVVPGGLLARDSKRPHDRVVSVSPASWEQFLAAVRTGLLGGC